MKLFREILSFPFIFVGVFLHYFGIAISKGFDTASKVVDAHKKATQKIFNTAEKKGNTCKS